MNQRQMRNLLIIGGLIVCAAVGIWAYNWIRGGHHYWVSAAAFNRDGTLLVTAAGDDHLAEIILWDVERARKVARQTLSSGRPSWIWFSGQDRQVVLSCDVVGKEWDDYKPNEIMFLDFAGESKHDSFVEPDLIGGTVALDQTHKLVSYGRNSIELRGLADNHVTKLWTGDNAGVNGLGVSADELHVAASCDGVARVWNLETQTELTGFDAPGADLGVIAVANGGDLVAASIYDTYSNAETFPVYFWDRAKGTAAVRVVQFAQPVTALRFLPGDTPRLLVVAGKDHLDCQASIYDPAGQLLAELYMGKAAIKSFDVTRDGARLVWVDSRGNGELWLLDRPVPTRQWKTTLGELRLIKFSPNTQLLVGHPWGPEFSLYDAKTGKVTKRFQGYQASNLSMQLLSFLPILLLLAGVTWYTKLRARHRKEGMLAVGKKLGWQHTSGALPDGIPDFHFFTKRGGGRFEHVLLGSGKHYDTLLAVYRWMQGSGDKKSPMHQLCVIYPHLSSDLPDVFVRPESFADKLAEYIGFSDVDLDGSKTLERFSSRYLLRTKAPEHMPDLINESLAEFLCEHEGWNIEIVDGSVLLWWQVVKSFTTSRFQVTDSASILDFVEESRTILELLVPNVAGRSR